MKTITLQAEVSVDGKLKVDVPCDLSPGPVEVVMVIQQCPGVSPEAREGWGDLYGAGADVWQGIDTRDYVHQLREDRDPRP